MKKLLTLPLALLLAACSVPDNPHGQFFKADQAYQATLRVTLAYVEACNETPRTNPCHDTKPKIAAALDDASAAFAEADRILSNPDATHYHLAITGAEHALNRLAKTYMERNPL